MPRKRYTYTSSWTATHQPPRKFRERKPGGSFSDKTYEVDDFTRIRQAREHLEGTEYGKPTEKELCETIYRWVMETTDVNGLVFFYQSAKKQELAVRKEEYRKEQERIAKARLEEIEKEGKRLRQQLGLPS